MRLVSLVILASLAFSQQHDERALRYLAGEVPRWFEENRCYSCHNNGDGARVLYVAKRLGHAMPPQALADTTRWLLKPDSWEGEGPTPAFSDKKLARIQYSTALAEAHKSGVPGTRDALRRAALLLVAMQSDDGAWRIEAEAGVGSPVTYGSVLATVLVRQTLAAADAAFFQQAIARANRWLSSVRAENLLDTSALLLAFPGIASVREEAAHKLLGSQTTDGGWGPRPHAPAQVFDTAIALLALENVRDIAGVSIAIARGRDYLTRTQLSSGGWPETTRPPGARSYAQHVSTTAWATLALLSTDSKGK